MYSSVSNASVFLPRLSVMKTNSTFDKEVVSVENQLRSESVCRETLIQRENI